MHLPILQNIRDYLWLMPFLCFFMGYAWIKYLYIPPEQTVPQIVGLTVYDALNQLSQQNLHLRILSEKIERELPPGTILWQTPYAGQKIKTLQTIFCVVSLQPKKLETLHCIGNSSNAIKKMVYEQGMKIKCYFLPNKTQPQGICFGQYPAPGSLQSNNTIITYIADRRENYVIVPSFQGKTMQEVRECLTKVGITECIIQPSTHHQCIHCKIKNQKPSAGSFVHISNLKKIELHVVHV